MSPGQEICFACGQQARDRAHHHEQPYNPLVFILAGVAVLAVVAWVLVINPRRARQDRDTAGQQEHASVTDSVRSAGGARRATTHALAQSDAAAALTDEINSLEGRFDNVRQKVVQGQPSQAQADLISQISSEIDRLHELAVTVAEQPEPKDDTLVLQLRDGEREVRTLITNLSHTPSS